MFQPLKDVRLNRKLKKWFLESGIFFPPHNFGTCKLFIFKHLTAGHEMFPNWQLILRVCVQDVVKSHNQHLWCYRVLLVRTSVEVRWAPSNFPLQQVECDKCLLAPDSASTLFCTVELKRATISGGALWATPLPACGSSWGFSLTSFWGTEGIGLHRLWSLQRHRQIQKKKNTNRRASETVWRVSVQNTHRNIVTENKYWTKKLEFIFRKWLRIE